MYLNEADAKKAIEDIAKKHTKDVKVNILRRKPKDLVSKYVFFGMFVSVDNGEQFFNDYMNATASSEYLEIVESEVDVDSRKSKEVFLLRAQVKVVGGLDATI